MAVVRMPLSVTSYCSNVHFRCSVCGSRAMTAPWPTDVGPVVDRVVAADAGAGRAGHRRQHGVAAAGEVAPRDVGGRLLAEDRRVVFPRRHVEEPGARAERRRVPVGAALIAGPRRLSRAAAASRIGRPLASRPLAQFTFTNGAPGEERAGLAVEHVEEAVAVGPQHRLGRRAAPVGCRPAPPPAPSRSRRCRSA